MAARTPRPSASPTTLYARFPAKPRALARTCLPRLRRAFPGTLQLVYDYPRSVVVAFGPSERGSEAFAALATDARGVRLYLPKDLPDPQRLFEGSGTQVRSVSLQAASDLERGPIHALLQAAVARAKLPPTRTRAPRTVVKPSARAKHARRRG